MTTPLPSANENWIDPIFDAIVSDIQASGYFSKVNQHEPKRKPLTPGLTAAVWLQTMVPLAGASGLNSTSAMLVFTARFYSNMLKEPQDGIDPNLMRATSNVMRRYHDNFDFGLHPTVRNVDLLGEFGQPLAAQAGYVEIDGTMFRVMDLTIPVVINDVWTQQA